MKTDHTYKIEIRVTRDDDVPMLEIKNIGVEYLEYSHELDMETLKWRPTKVCIK